MSLILDALSRAERDKRAGKSAAPDILSQQQLPAEPAALRWPAILMACGVMALIAVSSYWLWQGSEPALPSVPVAATTESDVVAAKPQSASRPTLMTPTIASAPVPAPEVAALYAESTRQIEQPEMDSVARAKQPEGSTSVSSTPPASIDVERVLRKVRNAYPQGEVAEHPVPLLDTLSQQFRDSVPTLMYMHHDYNPSGGSSVLLNGLTLGRGQRTRGVEVLEVLTDSVVLRFEGTEFRLRSLNSWVNL